jgi:hypothetical protein
MGQGSEDGIEYSTEPFADIFREESQHQEAVLLQQEIFVAIAAVSRQLRNDGLKSWAGVPRPVNPRRKRLEIGGEERYFSR